MPQPFVMTDVNDVPIGTSGNPLVTTGAGGGGASSVNISQVNGTTTASGNGTSTAGTLRTTEASDSPLIAAIEALAGPSAAGTTGATVPLYASYLGLNVAGNLRGFTGVNPSGTIYAGQVDVASLVGTTLVTGGVAGLMGVGGNIASGVADAGNPVKTGGVYNASGPTLTDGQRGNTQLSSRSEPLAFMVGRLATAADGIANTVQGNMGQSGAPGSSAYLATFSYLFNGSTWDRIRNANGAIGLAGSGLATETAGTLYNNITTGTTTTVKSGAGIFHAININTPLASATITIYDNTAASGTKIGTVTLPLTVAGPVRVTFDVAFATGLTLVTSAATDLTVTYR